MCCYRPLKDKQSWFTGVDARGFTWEISYGILEGENIHVLRTGELALIHAWELESLLINKFYNNSAFFKCFFPTMA